MTKRLFEQNAFLRDTMLLLGYMATTGYIVTYGEGERTQYQQDYYYAKGLSKVRHSRHQNRLAHDFNIYLPDGKWVGNDEKAVEILKHVGNYWENLNPKNVWGGRWKDPIDTGHFERRT